MSSRAPVAIVGLGGVFPGAPDAAALWPIVEAGRDVTVDVPAERWVMPPELAFRAGKPAADRVYATRAGLIADGAVESCPSELDLDPTWVASLDPSVATLLHAGVHAWRGVRTETLDRRRVGLIVGNIALPTDGASALSEWIVGRELERCVFAEAGVQRPATDAPPSVWNRWAVGLPASVLAHGLGLGGPTLTLDAACASSLFALHLAVARLQRGEVDLMLAGGTSRPSSLYTQMGFSQLGALSSSGRCSPFDRRADGLVVGEGAGVLALRRLDDAVAAGDRIWAIVRGTGLSNDVDGNLLAPSSEGQLRSMRTAYRQAGWAPGDVDLLECHATGTRVGDAVEFASVRALRAEAEGLRPVALGATKANVGHLLTGAGAVALIKAVLAMDRGVIPPVANFEQAGDKIDLEGSGILVPPSAQPWPGRDGPRRAAVSGFGFGGTNAHVLLEGASEVERSVSVSVPQIEAAPVAIVGMSARVGPWDGLEAVARRLFGEAPHRPAAKRHAAGFEPAPVGYFLDELEIPLGAYRIPPSELAELLPQQLLMLDVARRALSDLTGSSVEGVDTGVFVGIELDFGTTDYHLRWCVRAKALRWAGALGRPTSGSEFEAWVEGLCDALGPALDANRTMGGLASIAASRIAREFRIGGPSYTVSSDELSGFTALQTAVRALQDGELRAALVGAVDLGGDLRARLSQAALRVEGGDGTPLRLGGSGVTPAEGAVALVLKRRDDALRDGDRIYAVLEGIGSTAEANASLVATPAAYRRSVEQVLDEADVLPAAIGLVETAAVGNPTEDATELSALTEVIESGVPRVSAAAKFGDAGSAGGLLSVVSAALSLHHRRIGGLGNVEEPIDSVGRLPPDDEPWLHDAETGPRRVLVGDKTIGGQVGHAVLRAEDDHVRGWISTPEEALFVVEGETRSELAEGLERLRSIAADAGGQPVHRVARGWRAERGRRPHTQLGAGLVAQDLDQLHALARDAAEDFRQGRDPSERAPHRIFFSSDPVGRTGELAFVFPGSGSHFVGMGRVLGLDAPDVLIEQERRCQKLGSQVGPQLCWGSTRAEMDADPRGLILAQVCLGTLSSDALRRFGVRPTAVLGYSLGETAGLFSLGAWSERDAMLERVRASPLFTEELAGPCRAAAKTWDMPTDAVVDWRLGVVEATREDVDRALAAEDRAYRLIVNTPTECVIGGDAGAVGRVVDALAVPFHPLQGVTTVHCEVARQVEDAYRALHVLPTSPPDGVRFYSGAWGRSYAVDQASAAAAITDQATLGVDFPKVVRQAYEDGVRVFVELGPGGSCTRMIESILGDRPFAARSVSSPSHEGRRGWLRCLAMLVAERVDVDLGPLDFVESRAAKAFARTMKVPVGRQSLGAIPALPALPNSVSGTAARVEAPATEIGVATSTPILGPASAVAAAHDAFMRASMAFNDVAVSALTAQAELIARGARMSDGVAMPSPKPLAASAIAPSAPPRALDREQCLTFATGRIGDVLGPMFAAVDAHPTRVRLPAEPLMLVDRVTHIDAEPLSMSSGRVVTEHDVREGSWYLDGGRIPTCVAVEAGQADLFLSAYLGIDFETKGHAVYRLLDATVTFHDRLPQVGQTIRYDIRIDRFFRQGDTWLFRFGFDATVDGRPLMTMRDGCAGFFSEAELAAGRGVVDSRLSLETTLPSTPLAERPQFVTPRARTLDASQLRALRSGDLATSLGSEFASVDVSEPMTIPGGAMELVHRITALEPDGGRYGLGFVQGEADIHPDDWFITCHFSDDPVMPGTLMYECCMHTLRVFLLSLGWVGEQGEVVFEPRPQVRSRLKCRGQVLGHTRLVTYEVTMRQFGCDERTGEPFVICNATMYADGKRIVDIEDMSAMLRGTSVEALAERWGSATGAGAMSYDKATLEAFAYGKPSDAFGAPYAVFDGAERNIARLPGAPFQFIDRVPEVHGRPFVLESGCSCRAEVDDATWAWTLPANRQDSVAFAVLLEIGLQACGWLAAFAGSALTSDANLHFRNLGGDATLHRPVEGRDDEVLVMRAKMTAVSSSGGMIIQHFDFGVETSVGEPIYDGTTYFGFFSAASLADQVGIREAQLYSPSDAERARGVRADVPKSAPFPQPEFRMVDRVDLLVPDGGPNGLGYVVGSIDVDPEAWFFKAHFHEDPVWPGSLGLEAFLQLLKVFAKQHWDLGADARFSTFPVGHRHRWVYRGQVIPKNARVEVMACVTAVDEARRQIVADGFLCVDGRPIYQMLEFAIEVRD